MVVLLWFVTWTSCLVGTCLLSPVHLWQIALFLCFLCQRHLSFSWKAVCDWMMRLFFTTFYGGILDKLLNFSVSFSRQGYAHLGWFAWQCYRGHAHCFLASLSSLSFRKFTHLYPSSLSMPIFSINQNHYTPHLSLNISTDITGNYISKETIGGSCFPTGTRPKLCLREATF